MTRTVNPKHYEPFGGAVKLFKCFDSEVLLQGAAGTGKTFALLQKVHLLCEAYKGIRVLFIRKTLKSLRESVLVTWEEEVLGPGHPAITGTATRAHRDTYTFPNKSHIVLAGIDTPSRHMSTQFDLVCIFEAVECLEEDLEYLLTRCRNWKMPFQQLICDTNPRQPGHWLNQRAKRAKKRGDDPRLPEPPKGAKQMTRIKSFHEDNPFLYDHKAKTWTTEGIDYIGKLNGLHGARAAWFLKGEWLQAEGLVLPMWNPEVHVVDWDKVPPLSWYAASMDFGFNAPGCMQVWGFTGAPDRPIGEQKGYRVAEVYRSGWNPKQWAETAMELRQEHHFKIGIADCADPGAIDIINGYLGYVSGRKGGKVFQGSDKSMGVGAMYELLRSVLADEPAREEGGRMIEGGPRCFFVRDAFPMGLQQEGLKALGKPACTEDEIESLVYPENDGTKPISEKPDKACPEHGVSAARYMWAWGWKRDMTPKEDRYTPAPGTYGDLFGTPESLMRDKIARMSGRGPRLARRGR